VALVAATLTTGLTLDTAVATTTVTPTEAGTPPVVRGDHVDINIDLGALNYVRANTATAVFAAATPIQTALGSGCRGDNPAGTNLSARDEVKVTGPDGTVVLSSVSPVRNLGTSGFFTSPPNQPLNPQPAPSNTNYRGDFAASNPAFHGWKQTLDLTGKPAGTYTVTTTSSSTTKIGTLPCVVGVPAADNKAVVPGPVVQTQTFEYRPWQANFKDVMGKGSVHANITPREFQFSVGTNQSVVFQGTRQKQSFYSFGGSFLLPSDPAACAELITNCLPSGAVECDPAAGCVPRLMAVSQSGSSPDNDGIVGVFDLETKAFVAAVNVHGNKTTLTSLGTTNDALYHSYLQKLSDQAAAKGIDLASILATEVAVNNGHYETSLSLLNALQIEPSATKGGVHIFTTATVQAGIILDIYAHLRLTGAPCATNVGSSSTDPQRFLRNEDAGYTVTKTDLAPSVPSTGPLGAIVSGPVFHILGKFNGATAPLLNTASAVIGADTANNEPNGYPVWIQPFLSAPMHVANPKTMDFLGTATWSASEKPATATAGCLSVNFMLGVGAAIYNNPYPAIGFGLLLDPGSRPNANAKKLSAAVDAAVQSTVDSATSNPTVDSLLTQVVGALPLSGL
jgi:hypothetical protein